MPSINVRIAANLAELKAGLKEAQGELVTTTALMERATSALSGTNLIKSAHQYAAAISEIGGVSRLTASEQQRMHSLFEKSAEKLTLMGKGSDAATQEFRRLAEATKGVEKATETTSTSFGSMFKAFVAGQLSIAALHRVWRTFVDFVGSSVEAYAQQELAVKKLDTALKAQHLSVASVSPAYQEMAAQFQRTTKYGDELTIEMQALLTQIGGVMPSQMRGATQAAMDLASGLGVDLRTATMLVGKAFAGETGTLTRYGIVIDETKLKTEGASAVLDAIQSKFGGQAQAEVETYAGKVQQLGNAWGDFKEQIAKSFMESPQLEAALRALTERLQDNTAKVNENKEGWARWAFGLITGETASKQLQKDLDGYYDHLNEIARMTDRLLAQPSPFEQLAKRELPALTSGLELAREEWKKQVEAQDAAKKAAESHTKALQALMDQIVGRRAAQESRLFAEALMHVGDAGIHLTQGLSEVPGRLMTVVDDLGGIERAAPRAGVAMGAFGTMIGQNVGLPLERGIFDLNAWISGLGKLPAETAPAIKTTVDLGGSLADLGSAFMNLAQTADGSMSETARSIGTLVQAMSVGIKAAEKLKGGFKAIGTAMSGEKIDFEGLAAGILQVAAALPSMIAAMDQATSSGSRLKNIVGGMSAGAGIGAAWGPVGAAIGAGIGALIGGLRDTGKESSIVTAQMRDDFVSTAGGLEHMSYLARQLGLDFQWVFDESNLASFTAEAMVAKDMIDAWERSVQHLTTAAGGLTDRTAGFAAPILAAHAETVKLQGEWDTLHDQWARMPATTPEEIHEKLVIEAHIQGLEEEINQSRDKLSAFGETGEETFNRIGLYASNIFAETLTQTGSLSQAFEAVKPSLQTLTEVMGATGMETSGTTQKMLDLYGTMTDNADVFQSIDGLGAMMDGLGGYFKNNQELFNAFGSDAVGLMNEMVSRGMSVAEAQVYMQGPLQKLWESWKGGKVTVDDATRAMLEQAETAGVVGEDQRNVNERMLDVLVEIRDLWSGGLTDAVKGYGTDSGLALGGLQTKVTDFDWTPLSSDAKTARELTVGYLTGDTNSITSSLDETQVGINAITFDPMVLAARSARDDIEDTFGGMQLPRFTDGGLATSERGTASTSRLASSEVMVAAREAASLGPTVIDVRFDVRAIDAKGVKEFVEREAIPAIVDAMAGNHYESRANLRAAFGVR